MDSVALVKHEDDIEKTLSKGIEYIGGFGNLQSPVLIKPNICTMNDDTGFSVTDIKVVEGLIQLLLKEERNLAIRIVESDSESKFAEEAYKKFGYQRLEREMRGEGFDVALVDLSRSPLVSVAFDGLYFQNPEFPDILIGSKYVISLAVAKTHYLTYITGVLKNIFGILPEKRQSSYHSKITEVIVDLNRFVQPDLCIADARVGIEGWNGPKTHQLDTFIIGHKPVSVDATIARVMGFKPETIRHIVETSKYDLGTLDPIIQGEKLENITVKFDPPRRLSPNALLS